jgi:peptidoglycan/xylan/chitin deacetylase (PgdA/CDA1 family)
MNKKNAIVLFASLLLMVIFSSCLVTENNVLNDPVKIEKTSYNINPSFDFQGTIGLWKKFKKAAYTVTMDDGTYDQYSVAFPVMEELGIKGTYYLATNYIDIGVWDDHGSIRKMMNWNQAAIIARAGHEIGSHSLNHYDMSKSDINTQKELYDSREYIKSKIPGITVETFCWPHWRESPEAEELASKYYISARSGNGLLSHYLHRKGGIPSDSPDNMFEINALGFMNDQKKEDWQTVINEAYESQSWFVSSYHGVLENALTEWSPLTRYEFKETLLYPRDMGFWIDTFANVSKYIFERDNATLHIKNKKKSIEIILDDKLDDQIYNQTLSISFLKPENWQSMEIQNIDTKNLAYSERDNKIFIDIFPDGNPIVIQPLLTGEE